jgi:protein SCO1
MFRCMIGLNPKSRNGCSRSWRFATLMDYEKDPSPLRGERVASVASRVRGLGRTFQSGTFWFLVSAFCLILAPQLTAASSSTSRMEMPRGECQMEPDTAHGLPTNSTQTPALLRGVGITQRLNSQIPLDLVFRDASGKAVRLGDYFGQKPVILSLVYFNCPNLCTMVEDNLLSSLRSLKAFSVGKQFDVLTVSFDARDTPYMASDKRRIYLGLYGRKDSWTGWHFLTGSQASIDALCNAVGFHYKYIPQTHLFAHAVGIIVLTPQGRVSKYFYGLEYAPGQLRMALDQASGGKIGSPVDALLLFCCQYDPATGKYGLAIYRVLMAGGILTVLMIGGLIFILSRGGPKHPKNAPASEEAESVAAGRHRG